MNLIFKENGTELFSIIGAKRCPNKGEHVVITEDIHSTKYVVVQVTSGYGVMDADGQLERFLITLSRLS